MRNLKKATLLETGSMKNTSEVYSCFEAGSSYVAHPIFNDCARSSAG